MTKLSADIVEGFPEMLARSLVEDLSLVADGARCSGISPDESSSLKTGEVTLKRGFTALVGILKSLNKREAGLAYTSLHELILGAYVIGSRGVVDEIKIIEGPAVTSGKKGGHQSGLIKKGEAENNWAREGLNVAKEMRDTYPALSDSKIAQKIIDILDLTVPDRVHITRRVSSWVTQGSLKSSTHRRKRRLPSPPS